MNTLPFLQQVAHHYASQVNTTQLYDYAFVLPNRRSAQQLDHYFRQELNKDAFLPRFMTMNDLVDHIVRDHTDQLVTASTIETLFVLYEAYVKVMGDNTMDNSFDKFAHWGQLMVNDFNDVDMNLVDAKQLFTNLSDLKAIKTDYLDDDLKQAINSILSINLRTDDQQDKGMWSNNPNPDSVKQKYMSLWDKLYDIYTTYGVKLKQYGLTTQGKLYRLAAENIKEMDAARLGMTRIVMVGHDVLSVSEIAIFKALKMKGVADFWWDNASPALGDDNNPAHHIMRELAHTFPSPETVDKIDSWPTVTVQHVPSVVGMAKCAFEGIKEVRNDIAVVLPDEKLLEPLLNSLPDELIDKSGASASDVVNVTMGYSLRRSNIASLMRLVTIAHKHATRKGDGEWMFYREDVRDILSHPIIKMAYTQDVLQLNNEIEQQREFNIPASRFQDTALKPLFESLMQHEMKEKENVISFINNLKEFCNSLDGKLKQVEPIKQDASDTVTMSLQRAFIKLYVGALDQLIIAIDHVGLPVKDDTIFHLIDRVAASAMVPFGGRSDKGLQVMGLLETRCLDFDELRILSANENALPARANTQSLIPNRFRAAFHMPTIELNDATQTYRFYRLVSRASNVTLYSLTTPESEPSRFIEQLARVYGIEVNHVTLTAKVNVAKTMTIEIDNDKLRQHIKKKYTTGDVTNDKKPASCLSASSIKEYLKCPLKFYFHHIQGLSDDNEASDFMDSGEFGTIVHDTLQEFYYPDVPEQNRQKVFGKKDIDDFKKNKLDAELTRQINKTFNHKGEGCNDPLTGQGIILKETLRTYVERALKIDSDKLDKNGGTLEVVECEEKHPLKLQVGGVTINFTFKADRIDRIGDTLRIIDYKTGSDEVKFDDINEVFDNKKHKQVVLQLLLYCMAYVQLGLVPQGVTHIQPVVYKLSATKDNVGVLYKDKDLLIPVQGFLQDPVIKDFASIMASRLKMMWEDPINQTGDENTCKYCNFKDFCRR